MFQMTKTLWPEINIPGQRILNIKGYRNTEVWVLVFLLGWRSAESPQNNLGLQFYIISEFQRLKQQWSAVTGCVKGCSDSWATISLIEQQFGWMSAWFSLLSLCVWSDFTHGRKHTRPPAVAWNHFKGFVHYNQFNNLHLLEKKERVKRKNKSQSRKKRTFVPKILLKSPFVRSLSAWLAPWPAVF